mgnify:FL=1
MTAPTTVAAEPRATEADTSTADLNGVDGRAVGALVDAVRATPEAAATTWRAHVTWEGGFRSAARIRGFAPLASDEPPALGGDDTAPNPVEQVLAALGNCLAVGYAANAAAAGIAIRDLRVELAGDLDLRAFLGVRPGHAGFDAIRATVHLDADADPQAVARLHEGVVGSSPVGHTLQAAVPLAITLAGGGAA